MLSGWLRAGLTPSAVVVREPQPAPEIISLCARHGIALSPGDAPAGLGKEPAVIVAAVKPQVMDAVFPPLAQSAGPDTLTISIAAGRTIASFARHLPPRSAIIRAMPNTPAAIGHGITAFVASSRVSPGQKALARALLAATGDVVELGDEALMDAVTAVSGSGPAYVFLLAEALTEAGLAAGLPADVAKRLARQTVAGSGALLAASHEDAGELRRNVTSPGGTTAAALDILLGPDGLRPLMERAVAAATARSKALS